LLEAVKEPSRLDGVVQNLRDLARLFSESRELRIALENPAVPAAAKKAVLDAVMTKTGMEQAAASMARLMLENGRITMIPAVAQEFETMANISLNRIKVGITSAHPLAADEEKTLAESLKKFTGKTPVMTVDVDKSLIGGVVARIGSSVYDGSVRNQLKALKISLG
jgi:F-type H+-transporting ATPase subunit delta